MKHFVILLLCVLFSIHWVCAQSKIDSLIAGVEKERDDEKLTLLYLNLSKEYLKSNLEKSIECAQKALSIAQHIKNPRILASAYNTLGDSFFKQGSFDNALKYFIKGMEVSKKNNLRWEAIKATSNVGAVYSRMLNQRQALAYYHRALNEMKTEDPDSLSYLFYAHIYNNIANIYKETNDLDNALRYYRQSIAAAKKCNSINLLSIGYKNVGHQWLMMKQLDSAKIYTLKAIEIRTQLGDKQGFASS